MLRKTSFGLSVLAASIMVAATCPAQQVTLTSPMMNLNDSFYENFGMGWGLSGRNWFFNRGPSSSAIPPFGGYDPATDATFGFGGRFGNTNFNFNLAASQGSSRTMVMEAPSVTIPNGGSGSLFSGSQRPFVTGIIPVVGNNFPMMPGAGVLAPTVSPIQQRLEILKQQGGLSQSPQSSPAEARFAQPAGRAQADDAPLVLGGAKPPVAAQRQDAVISASNSDSTANHGDISVAEIRARQAALENAVEQEIRERIEKARSYEDAGKLGVARVYYQQAAARATGELKQKLLAKVESLR